MCKISSVSVIVYREITVQMKLRNKTLTDNTPAYVGRAFECHLGESSRFSVQKMSRHANGKNRSVPKTVFIALL